MNEIRAGQQVLIAALPLPLDGIGMLHTLVERLYGTGEARLQFSADGRSVAVTAPKDGFGPLSRKKALPRDPADGRMQVMAVDGDRIEMTLEQSEDVVLTIAEAMQQWFELSGGINYVTARFALPGQEEETGHHLTVQRGGNPTAHDLRQVAEERVTALEQQLRDLGHEPVASNA